MVAFHWAHITLLLSKMKNLFYLVAGRNKPTLTSQFWLKLCFCVKYCFQYVFCAWYHRLFQRKALERLLTPLRRAAVCLLWVIPQSGLELPEPPESWGSPPRSPCPHLHHYQLSLNSSDHHLNYPSPCPPDGFLPTLTSLRMDSE